jgi:glycosyltransferase involved in cell wall biosynthesis
MRFTVIVPVHNTAASLRGCITALLAQDYPRDRFEILMVDNNSTDSSLEILTRAEGVRVLSETTQGSYAARNRALHEARGEMIAFTDSDCFPDAGWIRAIDRAFENPRSQVVLGYRRPGKDSGLTGHLADYDNKKAERVFSSDCAESYYGYTNNMGVRRATLDRYGPFVELPRGADTVFVRRVVNGEGCEAVAYEPSMRIVHAEMRSVATYYKKTYTYGRSHRQFRHIMKTRPLGTIERLKVFGSTVRGGGYSCLSAAALACALAGGLAAWTMGSHSLAWSKGPVR